MTVRNFSVAKSIIKFEGSDQRAYWRRFAMLLTLSVIIATMGLLRNSSAVVIAAMLIAPLMTPILGIAAAMVTGKNLRATRLLLVVIAAAGASVGLAFAMVWIADVPRGVLVPDQVMARTDPGVEDLVVALASGVAGAYVQIQRSELSLLPGAAIGVSLVPPLSAAGVLVYFGFQSLAVDAILLFTTNLAAIVLSACAVYIAAGTRSVLVKGSKRKLKFTVSAAITMAIFALIAFKLAYDTRSRYREVRTEAAMIQAVADWAGDTSVEILRADADARRRTADLWLIVDISIAAGEQVASVNDLIPAQLRRRSLRDVMIGVLGPGYEVTVRYQTRIAGTVALGTDVVRDAEPVQQETLQKEAAEGN